MNTIVVPVRWAVPASLRSELVDEHDRRACAMGGTSELAKRLAHEAGLKAHVRGAHVAVELGLGHQGGNGIDHHQVHCTASHQHLRDVERLLPAIGLAHQELLGIHAEVLCVVDIERVLRVDERRDATHGLALRDGVQGERRLATRFGAEYLDDPALGVAAAAECLVERGAAGRDARHPFCFSVAEPHHGALAKLFFNALQECIDGLEWLFHVLLLLCRVGQ